MTRIANEKTADTMKTALTISSFQFVISRFWYGLVIDMGTICGIQINYERPYEKVLVRPRLWRGMFTRLLDNALRAPKFILLLNGTI